MVQAMAFTNAIGVVHQSATPPDIPEARTIRIQPPIHSPIFSR